MPTYHSVSPPIHRIDDLVADKESDSACLRKQETDEETEVDNDLSTIAESYNGTCSEYETDDGEDDGKNLVCNFFVSFLFSLVPVLKKLFRKKLHFDEKSARKLSGLPEHHLLESLHQRIEKQSKEVALAIINELNLPSPKRGEMTHQNFLNTCQTGDVVLWSGSSPESKVIRYATKSAFSHASIIFKGKLDDSQEEADLASTPRIFQATWSTFPEDVHGSHRIVAKQVMLNDLKKVLEENENEGEPATLRRLQCEDFHRPALQEELRIFINKSLGDAYPGADRNSPNPSDFIRGILHLQKKHPDQYFCSELVSASLQRMGVLDLRKADNSWTPEHFSEKGEKVLKTHLNFGYSFGPEVSILTS